MAETKGYMHNEAFNTGKLAVGDIHVLHYDEYGNPDGKPVIFLHGGPGASTSKTSTIFFNPATWRVVLLDQRGSGQSTPRGELRENTTAHLVADIEALRQHLGIPCWSLVFGGSWGTTLALAYAESFPARVGAMVLRGVYLGQRAGDGLGWSGAGAPAFFPELQEALLAHLEPAEREQPELAYYHRLTSGDAAVELAAAWAWRALGARMTLDADPSKAVAVPLEAMAQADRDNMLARARIETHYIVNSCFLRDAQLLDDAHRIAHLPTTIIQGRLDMICPPKMAWALHRALQKGTSPQNSKGQLFMVPGCGHGAYEPATLQRLIQTCDTYGSLVANEV